MLPLRAEIRTDAPILDERSAARRTLRLEVSAHAGSDATTALIHNLSETGLLIESSADLQIGEMLQVNLPHAGTTKALVIWSQGGLFGCEFVSPVSPAAISAALLRNPFQPRLQTQTLPVRIAQAEVDDRTAERERRADSKVVLVASLIMSLFIVLAFVLALLTFPISN